MNSRIRKYINLMHAKDLEACLVCDDVNISYLTGFPSRESWLLITSEKVCYITDFRYYLEAKKHLKGITVFRYRDSISMSVGQLMKKNGVSRIGYDSRHLTCYAFRKLKKDDPPKTKWIIADHLVETLRDIKEPSEIRLIKKAVDLNLKAFNYIGSVIEPGMTEKQILLKLEYFVRNHQASFAFPPIIASGSNSCLPHAQVSDRKLRKNDILLIDMGINISGYKSDLTRMFFLGKIPNLIREITSFVRESQRKAIRSIRPGCRAKDIDFAARKYLKSKKLEKYFGHSLGHGVGLQVHESPAISSWNSEILKEGMVFTIEPAVYIPQQFGIRIEDMVHVTQNGVEVLSDHLH